MNRFLILSFFSVFFFILSCESEDVKERPIIETKKPLPLIQQTGDGRYTEWYPGHNQIKMQGRINQNGERTGIWKYYSEQGVELSVTVYTNGEKDGHIVVKRPTGVLHYTGEYVMGKEVGEWRFYNEQGELVETKIYE
ncbi:MAG: hypothetical protein WC994_05400 [Brumimicrobium sp.]